ncbi:hypothetical protein MY4824_009861 [Beauveria thailandica]
MPEAKPQISWLAILDLIPGAFSIFLAGLIAACTGLWRSKKDAPTLFLHIAYAVMRKTSARYSPVQLQWALPTSDQVYRSYARSAKIKPEIINLANGASGYWVGDKHAKNIIIWFHGGGFNMAAVPAFFEFWQSLIVALRRSDKDVAIFAMSYSLAPQATYPTQLIQAVDALRYINSQKQRAESIVLAGDSAGASLAFGVLSHLAHPHPAIDKLQLAKPLDGFVVVGYPGATNDAHAPAGFERYWGGDLIDPVVVENWMKGYLGNSAPDYYTDPISAPDSWFHNLPTKRMLLLAGGNELLRPMIEAFAQKLKPIIPNLEFFIGQYEAHIAPVYNLYVGDKTPTQQGLRLIAWLESIF